MASAPKPPADISRDFQAVWRATQKEVADTKGGWKEVYGELVSRYVRALERAHESRETIKAVDAGTDERYLIRGRMLKSLREAEQDADARAKMLLLTPESRQKLELPKGDRPKGRLGL